MDITKNYIHLYPNKNEDQFNMPFLRSENDTPIVDLIILCMKEFEAVENITILGYDIVYDQDEVDINEHNININYKKKKTDDIKIPKNKYVTESRYGEIIFRIKITTNLSERVIVKKILFPMEYEGFYVLNSKKWKATWQLLEASTYSQRGKITLKSRMPIIIYHSKRRELFDASGESHIYSAYSYALNTRSKRRNGKTKTKFINPFMIYAAKVGLRDAIKYFGFAEMIDIVEEWDSSDDKFLYFPLNDLYIKVNKYMVENHKIVQSMVGMLYSLSNKDFPVTKDCLNDKEYWICRIGYIGSIKNKNIKTFYEKGNTTLFMIERLLDNVTINNLRLPQAYKYNVYAVMRWMILDFDSLKNRNNLDVENKRIRKNEYIVLSSLGKKISENINKLIEKKSKSKMNTMDTLLELFNFGSDIVVAGMRNINDLIKSDELVNDLTFLQDLSYSTKGPNSLGENANKKVSIKYRNIHPSFIGKIDCSTTSNSDAGMSGAFVPFVTLYDNFYFREDGEPCDARFKIEQFKREFYSSEGGDNQALVTYIPIEFDSLEDYINFANENEIGMNNGLNYEKIEIVEKDDD